jgi:hypothetical protein
MFAPWCIHRSDFLAVGGHDTLFAPQSREDSDLFNRFVLNGYELVQSWEALVYHFTSRGSRFNRMSGGDVGQDSSEWKLTNRRNERNFIRKWGSAVETDEFLAPRILDRFEVALVLNHAVPSLIRELEPWFDVIHSDLAPDERADYIKQEQPNTDLDLERRLRPMAESPTRGVVVHLDGATIRGELIDASKAIRRHLHVLARSSEGDLAKLVGEYRASADGLRRRTERDAAGERGLRSLARLLTRRRAELGVEILQLDDLTPLLHHSDWLHVYEARSR